MMHSIYRTPARRGVSPIRLLAASAAVTLLVVGACTDVPAPADPMARAMAAPSAGRATVFEPEFNRYTAKVVVTMTGGGIRQLPAMPERRVEYGIERQLERGEWTTTYDFGSVRQGSELRRVPIRKVVAGLDGMKYYDHNGDLIPLGTRLPATLNGNDFPDLTAAPPRGARSGGGDPRAWAENLVTTVGQGAQRRARIAQSFERAEGRGRTVRYRKEREGTVTEIVVDTTRGTIEETRTSKRGGFKASTRFEYRDIGDNRWLRVRAVQQREDETGNRHPFTVEQVFVDQRFDRAEGR